MEQHARSRALERLEAFVGEWSMEAAFPPAPPADIGGQTTFEWLPGERFLVQRWEVPVPDAPDGIAIIGLASGRAAYLQHYFDSRGVARIYQMEFAGGVWKLWRDSEDFSPLHFSQRFTATFGADGETIDGRWETSADGSSWEHDFDLTYRKIVRPSGSTT